MQRCDWQVSWARKNKNLPLPWEEGLWLCWMRPRRRPHLGTWVGQPIAFWIPVPLTSRAIDFASGLVFCSLIWFMFCSTSQPTLLLDWPTFDRQSTIDKTYMMAHHFFTCLLKQPSRLKRAPPPSDRPTSRIDQNSELAIAPPRKLFISWTNFKNWTEVFCFLCLPWFDIETYSYSYCAASWQRIGWPAWYLKRFPWLWRKNPAQKLLRVAWSGDKYCRVCMYIFQPRGMLWLAPVPEHPSIPVLEDRHSSMVFHGFLDIHVKIWKSKPFSPFYYYWYVFLFLFQSCSYKLARSWYAFVDWSDIAIQWNLFMSFVKINFSFFGFFFFCEFLTC